MLNFRTAHTHLAADSAVESAGSRAGPLHRANHQAVFCARSIFSCIATKRALRFSKPCQQCSATRHKKQFPFIPPGKTISAPMATSSRRHGIHDKNERAVLRIRRPAAEPSMLGGVRLRDESSRAVQNSGGTACFRHGANPVSAQAHRFRLNGEQRVMRRGLRAVGVGRRFRSPFHNRTMPRRLSNALNSYPRRLTRALRFKFPKKSQFFWPINMARVVLDRVGEGFTITDQRADASEFLRLFR